jgi:hypothetical protein
MIPLILSPRLRTSERRARQQSSVCEGARRKRARGVCKFANSGRLVDLLESGAVVFRTSEEQVIYQRSVSKVAFCVQTQEPPVIFPSSQR